MHASRKFQEYTDLWISISTSLQSFLMNSSIIASWPSNDFNLSRLALFCFSRATFLFLWMVTKVFSEISLLLFWMILFFPMSSWLCMESSLDEEGKIFVSFTDLVLVWFYFEFYRFDWQEKMLAHSVSSRMNFFHCGVTHFYFLLYLFDFS